MSTTKDAARRAAERILSTVTAGRRLNPPIDEDELEHFAKVIRQEALRDEVYGAPKRSEARR